MHIILSQKVLTDQAIFDSDIKFFYFFYFQNVYKTMYNMIKNRFSTW